MSAPSSGVLFSTRKEAKKAGARRYFTGKPCPKGHTVARRTVNYVCIECNRLKGIGRKRKNNPEVSKRSREKYLSLPENRETQRAACRTYRENNLIYFREASSRRRAHVRSQICTCCARQDLNKIYKKAATLAAHVDHIIPIALGGPHCCKNLQILSIEEHKMKTTNDFKMIFTVSK